MKTTAEGLADLTTQDASQDAEAPIEIARIEIEVGARGQRLDKFVAEHFHISRAQAVKRLEGATLDGAEVKASFTLRGGEVLEIAHAPEAPPAPPPVLAADVALPPILFEDEHFLVIDKPRGLVVHAGAGETGATLVDVLRAHGKALSSSGPPERAGIVHRLDKDTTGTMVIAKTDQAHAFLARAFEERRVGKVYVALCCGLPRTPGRIEAPVARHPSNRLKMAVAPHGKAATTLYRVVESWPKLALCHVDLLTGRTHQIRAHFSYMGNPIAGDELYGGQKRAVESAASEEVKAALEALEGQALHAWKLQFEHPETGEEMKFEAPLQPDFQNALDVLRADAIKNAPPERAPSLHDRS